MIDDYNLSELALQLTKEHVARMDGAIAQYVKASIQLLENQGEDITEYTMVQIYDPARIKDDGRVVTSSWRIMKIDELQERLENG